MRSSGMLVILLLASSGYTFQIPTYDGMLQYLGYGHQRETQPHPRERLKRSRPSIADRSNKLYEIETDDIPRHKDNSRQHEILDRYMPILGNGHIATTVYNYTIFMNNYYSRPVGGKTGEVYRAAIPAKIMYQVNFTENEYPNEQNALTRFRFNVQEGYFVEEIDCSFAIIKSTMYVHRKYTSLFIMDLHIVRKQDHVGDILLQQKAHNNASEDLLFDQIQAHEKIGFYQTAKQKNVEEGGTAQTLHIFWNEIPPLIQVKGRDGVFNYTYVMSVHTDSNRARVNFDYANKLINERRPTNMPPGSYDLFMEHVAVWQQTWDNTGHIVFEGNNEISKMLRFGMYNILSALPALESAETKDNDDFAILSRTGLGRGAIGKDYQGHVFWDSEMYLLPSLLFFRPDLAKIMLRYRISRSTEASNIAGAYGDKGYRYPWESAKTGRDVTPDNGATCRDQQIHVTGAVSFAARQYWSATREESARTAGVDNLCELVSKIADFWFERAKYNPSTRRYHIENVMGPDDSHPNITNNAYTNAMASLSLHWSGYFACICGRGNSIPEAYIRRAIELYMPFNENGQFHFAFHDMDKRPEGNLTFRQADTTLLGYPLLWNMSSLIQKNDLMYYMEKMVDNPPSMSYAFSAAGFAMAGDKTRANEAFSRAAADYIARPFHMWTEYREDTDAEWLYSSTNYLPAIGAYIQACISGWAGLRLRPEQIDIHRAMMPINTNKIVLHGFKYLQNNMTLEITENSLRIEVHNRRMFTLRVRRNTTRVREEYDLEPGNIIQLTNMDDGYVMFAVEKTNCDVPMDYIETVYSPWVNAASQFRISLLSLVLTWITCRIHL